MRGHRVQLARIALACVIALALLPLRSALWSAAENRVRVGNVPVEIAEGVGVIDGDAVCLWRD